ncbi:MAG: AbrB/MazE/SpoVT family DNA-binding domain-containing protein [Sporichthyaceae bacterium]
MRTTIDKAGRLVIPKALRDQLGLTPGEVEVSADGAALRVEAIAGEGIVEVNGRWVIPASGVPIDPDLIQAMIDEDRNRHLDV